MKDGRAELVRIDSRGEAHPIGSVASQRMRAREGAYRMLPAPAHVVFMRYTGEDGRRDADDGAIVRLSGEVTAPGTLCDILALLAQTGWRGELVVLDGDDTRSIFFEQGNVVGASTNVEAERLGSVLYRFGVITGDERDRILAAVRGGKRFGEAAIELGVLKQDQIYSHIARQIEEIVFATMTIGDGTFFFLEGFDEARLVSRHTVSANALLMDGVTRMDELRYFRQKIPSAEHIPFKVENRGTPQEEFHTLYFAIDGQQSVEELGRSTGLGEFETTKALYSLVQSQHVSIHPPRVSGGPTSLVAAANGALRAIFSAADHGGRVAEVRANLESFAVGAGVYDILFRNAGPDESGALDPDAVAANSVVVAGSADRDNMLKQMLHEYVSFALFSAGAALGSGAEGELVKQVASALASLRPQG
ncbi:MAG TPA: DUF4388 domain-containing protein [Polyangiaceae bacterium]|jgi:hypothetical protein|nr:DUF4388 domain-containing protein [Polyangiaceae bacterium]